MPQPNAMVQTLSSPPQIPTATYLPTDLTAEYAQPTELVSTSSDGSPEIEATREIQLSLPVEAVTPDPSISPATLELAARDVRMVLREQSEQSQILTTKLNILFVANGALLTSLAIARLIMTGSLLSLAEGLGFVVSFSLLMGAFLPRQVAVSPNLEDQNFLETYLLLAPQDYQLQMLVNLAETYKANKQRLEDISQSLKYAAYTIWGTAVIMLVHILVIYLATNTALLE